MLTPVRAEVWAQPRQNLSLTPDARWATALCRYDGRGPQVEIWRRRGGRWSPAPAGVPAAVTDQLLALPGGRALLRTGREIRVVGRGATATAARLAEPAIRVLPAPPGARSTRCLLLACDQGVTRLYRLTSAGVLDRCPGELGGRTEDGVWLDHRRLALTLVRSGAAGQAVIADVTTGEVSTLLDIRPDTADRAELYSAASTLLVVRTDAGGAERIGFARLRASEPFWFPAETSSQHGIRPLALDPAGRRLLVHEQRGVYSDLAIYDVLRRTRSALETPPGRLRGPAAWTGDGIIVPWSAPTAPHAMLRLLPGQMPPSLDPVPGACPARVVTVVGAAGPLEAIAYGADDWARARYLVVALHGGPLAAWRYEFHPLFAALAFAGVSVLALNQRGSTGYGLDHTAPIRDGWGGPDLADVTAVLRYLAGHRGEAGPPAIVGQSYGAFLALLAACALPGYVRACVAIAPFRSAAALYAGGSPEVRDLISRLDGLREVTDALGARDLSRLAARITAPTLLIHGARDEVIPVGESRALRASFRPGADLTYLELPDCGHDPLSGRDTERVTAAIRGFVRPGKEVLPMSMSVMDLQALPEERPSLFHAGAELECCSFTCGSNSCGATCPATGTTIVQ